MRRRSNKLLAAFGRQVVYYVVEVVVYYAVEAMEMVAMVSRIKGAYEAWAKRHKWLNVAILFLVLQFGFPILFGLAISSPEERAKNREETWQKKYSFERIVAKPTLDMSYYRYLRNVPREELGKGSAANRFARWLIEEGVAPLRFGKEIRIVGDELYFHFDKFSLTDVMEIKYSGVLKILEPHFTRVHFVGRDDDYYWNLRE